MEKRIQITSDENETVELLYSRFTSYCNILGYLAKYGSIDTDLFDRKWEEAVNLNRKLEKLKIELDSKYHPKDNNNYINYTFDFMNEQMVYTDE